MPNWNLKKKSLLIKLFLSRTLEAFVYLNWQMLSKTFILKFISESTAFSKHQGFFIVI